MTLGSRGRDDESSGVQIRNSSGVVTEFLLCGPISRPLTSPLMMPAVATNFKTPPVFQVITSGSISSHSPRLL